MDRSHSFPQQKWDTGFRYGVGISHLVTLVIVIVNNEEKGLLGGDGLSLSHISHF